MKHVSRLLFGVLTLLVFAAAPAWAQTGKIAGVVTDVATGEALPGVNVVIDGTTQGATTGPDGYYVILNVNPGTYTLRASFIGFAMQVIEDVSVNINLTSEVDIEMREQAVGLDEITVQATEPIVKPDISANVANISAESIENLPVGSVEDVISLQAGIEPGMSVRGGGLDQLSFMMDGHSMRAGRDNTPFMGVSYTSIEEVQVQTGGFSAEYGNVRSGLVNVVTKEGSRDRYTADVMLRYAPAQKSHFGIEPNAPTAYWMRPYVDPDVAFDGTHAETSPWDSYLQDQYPRFEGWNSVSQQLLNDDDPTNDLTVDDLMEVFEWHHRKDVRMNDPKYELDATIGGPIPLIADALGNLRFIGSYRQVQKPYIMPQMRTSYLEQMGQMKVTSDIGRAMKLTLQGLYATQAGINTSSTGGTAMFTGERPRYPWDSRGDLMASHIGRDGIFATHVWSPMDVTRSMVGADFTHSLGQKTFYKVTVQRVATDYETYAGRDRDTSTVRVLGSGYRLDESPFGYTPAAANSFNGLRISGHWGSSRDSSTVRIYSARTDVTSQMNPFWEIKGGLEYIYSDYETIHGEWDPFFVSPANPKYRWFRNPHQGAGYFQNKLEFEGMVANLGLRAEVFNAGGDYYTHDVYERAFTATQGWSLLDQNLETRPAKTQVTLSPRLGVSFPVTVVSKLFFNYGHFRSMLNPHALFAIERSFGNKITFIGNPEHPMPLTVAYELGYEHALFDRYLVRVSGYYRALSKQPRNTQYESIDGLVDYSLSLPNNYGDVRGLELTLTKNAGRWVRGFVNFTYMARKSGDFGLPLYYENRSQQRQYERNTNVLYQSKPVPEPYAHFNLEFLTPPDFGPSMAGSRLLGDWRLNLLGEWRSGQVFTWSGGASEIVGLENNVRWKDYYNVDLRLSKNLSTPLGNTQFFADVSNMLNLRHMYRTSAFEGTNDFRDYMMSLHLSENTFEDVEQVPYQYIRGNDRPGDFRTPGVEFVPIEIVPRVEGMSQPASARPIFFELDTEKYMEWAEGGWREVSDSRLEKILDEKAYIDMPNQRSFAFLNPRQITFGVRVRLQ